MLRLIKLIFMVLFLSSCAPVNVLTPIKATVSVSDSDSLAAISGSYLFKSMGKTFHFWLRSDGTYANFTGSGSFTVAPGQITFVDTQASSTYCGSDPGTYKWSLDKDKLTFVLINDNCEQRMTVLSSYAFEKVQNDTNMPVEFVWRITGAPNTLGRPGSIVVDSQSNIYVIDAGNHRIQKFDADGKFLMMWGGKVKRTASLFFLCHLPSMATWQLIKKVIFMS